MNQPDSPAADVLAYHIRNHGLDRTVDECERCKRAAEQPPTGTDADYGGDGLGMPGYRND